MAERPKAADSRSALVGVPRFESWPRQPFQSRQAGSRSLKQTSDFRSHKTTPYGPNPFSPRTHTRWTWNPSFWLIAQIRGFSESLKVRKYW